MTDLDDVVAGLDAARRVAWAKFFAAKAEVDEVRQDAIVAEANLEFDQSSLVHKLAQICVLVLNDPALPDDGDAVAVATGAYEWLLGRFKDGPAATEWAWRWATDPQPRGRRPWFWESTIGYYRRLAQERER